MIRKVCKKASFVGLLPWSAGHHAGNGTVTSCSYDGVSRLASLTQDLAGTAYDFTNSFTYDPARRTASNDAYAWSGHCNIDRSYGTNGLNQLTTAGSTALGYDGRGNLTSLGSAIR